MSIRFRKAKALQTAGATLWKGDSKWVRAVQSETPAGGLLSLQNEDVKRIPANGVRERPPSQGDLEEAALGPSPLSRPARGVNARAPGGRPTEHGGARRTPRRPSPVTCRNLRPSVSSAGRADRGSSPCSMAAAANNSPAALPSSELPVRPYVHVALTAAAVLTYRGSTCLDARPITEGV